MLKQWIKNLKTGRRIGVVVAGIVDNKVAVGYSLWNRRLDKRCVWEISEGIAQERMLRDATRPYSVAEIPHSVRGTFFRLASKMNWSVREEEYVQPRDISDFFSTLSNIETGLNRFYGGVVKMDGDHIIVKIVGGELSVPSTSVHNCSLGDYVRVKRNIYSGHTRVDRV